MNLRLIAKDRINLGKGSAGRTRKEGWVPAVIYGKEIQSQAIQLEEKGLEKAIATQGLGALVEVQIDNGKPYAALFREIQRHPVKGTLVHCDLYQVPLTSTIQTIAPVILEGEPIGVENGGVFQHGLREIDIECVANQIPEGIPANVSQLDVGDTLKVGDIPEIAGVKFITDPDTVIASVIAPRAVEETEEVEGTTEAPIEAQEEPAEEA